MKEVVKDISLYRPLAPSSVFLLETQAKMLICVLPWALLSPTPLTFLNESRHGNTVQVQLANTPIVIMLLIERTNYFGITGSNRDL